MPRIPDLFPSINPGIRFYGGIRHTDPSGYVTADNFDFQRTIATSGLTVDLSASLPANDTWITLWDGAVGTMLIADGAFVTGFLRGTGGIWYLEERNVLGDLSVRQMPGSGQLFTWPTGNTYSSAAAVSAINRLRARVLTGASATVLDGYLVR